MNCQNNFEPAGHWGWCDARGAAPQEATAGRTTEPGTVGYLLPPPQILTGQLSLFQPGGRLCPPHYYLPTRIFRPSVGSGSAGRTTNESHFFYSAYYLPPYPRDLVFHVNSDKKVLPGRKSPEKKKLPEICMFDSALGKMFFCCYLCYYYRLLICSYQICKWGRRIWVMLRMRSKGSKAGYDKI